MDEAFCKLAGVNRTDGRCLDVIDQRPGLTAGELAAAVGLSPARSRRRSTGSRRAAS